MTRIEYVFNKLKDIRGKTPVLLVGSAGFLFKQIYKGNIYRVENTDDARELISNLYGVEYNKPIVVEDISLLYKDTILLKLVEEIKLPLILIATEDNISVPLQSRIKTYIKFPKDTDFSCSNIKVLEAYQYITEEDLQGKNLDKYLAENCPKLALYYDSMKTRKNKDKIVQILGGLENKK